MTDQIADEWAYSKANQSKHFSQEKRQERDNTE